MHKGRKSAIGESSPLTEVLGCAELLDVIQTKERLPILSEL